MSEPWVHRRWPRLLVPVLLASSLGLVACTPAFTVTAPYPPAGQTVSSDLQLDSNGAITIRVTFSDPFDDSSVNPTVNVQLIGEKTTTPHALSTALDPSNAKVMVITTPAGTEGDLCIFDPDCFFTLKILGDGSSPVKSSSGTVLDGNRSGSPGGTYSTRFVIIG